ncbi:hypothetical protein BC835DRAFT_693527 [Cytidiella melzeri]|nr:hypothetical protein BC835DRAFT_693527 [Cytidiella melzeri]
MQPARTLLSQPLATRKFPRKGSCHLTICLLSDKTPAIVRQSEPQISGISPLLHQERFGILDQAQLTWSETCKVSPQMCTLQRFGFCSQRFSHRTVSARLSTLVGGCQSYSSPPTSLCCGISDVSRGSLCRLPLCAGCSRGVSWSPLLLHTRWVFFHTATKHFFLIIS